MPVDFKIEPLTVDSLEEAIGLANSAFPEDTVLPINPEISFRASLAPENYRDFIKNNSVKDLKYFVVIDKGTGKIIGTTGLYHLTTDPADTVWLGWYCLKPSYRCKGIGESVLRWTIDNAREEGARVLNLYTTSNHVTAQALYDKLGFKVIGNGEEEGQKIIYMQLGLGKIRS